MKPFMVWHHCTYIDELLTIKSDSSSKYNLRSRNKCLLEIPRIRSYKKLGDRSFSIAAPKIWNALPEHIRLATTIDSFKEQLKTHLFKLV